jgi:hypothetical protein
MSVESLEEENRRRARSQLRKKVESSSEEEEENIRSDKERKWEHREEIQDIEESEDIYKEDVKMKEEVEEEDCASDSSLELPIQGKCNYLQTKQCLIYSKIQQSKRSHIYLQCTITLWNL